MTIRLPVALALAGLAPGLAAQRITYEGAMSASTGRYFFTERTSSFGLSTGLSLRSGRWTVRATVPVWLQNTTLLSSSGLGPVPTGGPEGQGTVSDSGEAREQRRQGKVSSDPAGDGSGSGTGGDGTGKGGSGSGTGAGSLTPLLDEEAIPAPELSVTGYQARIGDPVLAASVRVIDAGRLAVTIGTTVKVPLASSTTIGTGAWDLAASLSATAEVGSRGSIGLDLSYWHLGDLDSLELRDPLLASLSIGTLLGERWAALVALSASTTTLTGYDPPVTVSAALSRYAPGFTWGIALGAGLTESAPDLMVAITWSVPFGGGGWP